MEENLRFSEVVFLRGTVARSSVRGPARPRGPGGRRARRRASTRRLRVQEAPGDTWRRPGTPKSRVEKVGISRATDLGRKRSGLVPEPAGGTPPPAASVWAPSPRTGSRAGVWARPRAACRPRPRADFLPALPRGSSPTCASRSRVSQGTCHQYCDAHSRPHSSSHSRTSGRVGHSVSLV